MVKMFKLQLIPTLILVFYKYPVLTIFNYLSIVYCSGSQTASQKTKATHLALSHACETIEPFFNKSIIPTIAIDQLKQFEIQLQTTLKHMIQISINNKHSDHNITKLKSIYSQSLQSQIKRDDFLEYSQHLKNVLQTIQQSNVIQF